MSQRRVSGLSSLAKSMNRFFGPAQTKQRRRKQTRLRLLEQLESRQLLALDIIGISPADGAFDVAPDTDLVITFNENVLRGQGNIHVVDSATGKAVVTIDLPQDLPTQTDFTVFIDPGTFIDTSGATTADATLLTEGFEFLPLGPAVWETVGDGTDFTLSPPINWSVDNSNMPTTEAYGVPEWDGWSFADKSFWIAADNQTRDNFLLGQGTLAIADSDEFDDRGPRQGPFDSLNAGDWTTTKHDAIEGVNLIEARQTDTAGNLGAVGSLTFTLDVTAPGMPTIVLAEDTGIDDDFITSIGDYTVTPAESGGLVEYRLNESGEWSTTAPTAVEGMNFIEARQIDTAGNFGAIGSLTFTLDSDAPVVTNVYATSTAWTAGFIDAIDGGGTGAGNGIGIELTAGLLPLPWSNVNTLVVQFSEDILGATSSTLEVRDSLGVIPATVTYDAATFQAVIALPATLNFAKIRVAVSDSVEDIAGNPLDGGTYDLRFNVLGGDGNGDGRVNGSDLQVLSSSFNRLPGQAGYNARANWNGVDRVNGADLSVFNANFNRKLVNLDEPSAAFGGGGGGSGAGGFRNFGSMADDLFGKLGEDDEENERFFGM